MSFLSLTCLISFNFFNTFKLSKSRWYKIFLGILLLGIINVALPVLNIPGEFQKAIYGLIIVVALALDQLIIYRMKKLSGGINA